MPDDSGLPVRAVPVAELIPAGPNVKGSSYSESVVELWTQLVTIGGVSMRGVERVLAVIGLWLGVEFPCPHWTTGRSWLQRLGLAELMRPLELANDWIWLLDHAVQIGKLKVLAIIGVRRSQLPPFGQALQMEDMQLIALIPMLHSTAAAVCAAMEQATLRTGVPRAVVTDHGTDLLGGVALFRKAHPETAEIYDIAHRVAIFLKTRLEKDPQWAAFIHRSSLAKQQLVQTELAALLPPSLRPKARYMNVDPLFDWGGKMLALLSQVRAGATVERITADRVLEKLSWLDEYASVVAEWQEWWDVLETGLDVVRSAGHSLSTPHILAARLPKSYAHPSSKTLADELEEFVKAQSTTAGYGERLPGSTEVLESTFGRFKKLESDQVHGGFTGLLPSLGALLGQLQDATCTVGEKLAMCSVKNLKTWITENLGQTVASQRRLINDALFSATETAGTASGV